jgi:hypothetical protein
MSSEEIKLIVDDYMMNLYIRMNVIQRISNKRDISFINNLMEPYAFIVNNKGKLAYSIEVLLYSQQYNRIERSISCDSNLLKKYLLTGIGDYKEMEDSFIKDNDESLPF